MLLSTAQSRVLPTSLHLVEHHAHLFPSYPVRFGLRLIRSPPPGPTDRDGERPRLPLRLRDHRPPG
jgi:hypothetical protein